MPASRTARWIALVRKSRAPLANPDVRDPHRLAPVPWQFSKQYARGSWSGNRAPSHCQSSSGAVSFSKAMFDNGLPRACARRMRHTMLATGLGVMRALNRQVERVFKLSRKDPHGGGCNVVSHACGQFRTSTISATTITKAASASHRTENRLRRGVLSRQRRSGI